MKPAKLFYFMIFSCVISGLFSCEDKNIPELSPKDGIAVRTVEATADFDLSARKNWKMYIGTVEHIEEYYFTVEGNKLIATSPVDAPYRFPFDAAKAEVVIQLVHQDYGKTRNSSGSLPLSIENQSTAEKFLQCDRLKIDYYGEPKENLKELNVLHFNTLLDFTVKNLPEDSKVYINQLYQQKITPLQSSTEPENYRAIIFPHNPYAVLSVETNGKVYQTRISEPYQTRMDLKPPAGFGNSTLINFTAEINDDDELVISELKIKRKAEWSVTE